MERESTQVSCYSGLTYAERPTSFLWEGTVFNVKRIEKEWNEPGERHFRLRTDDDRLFELCYDEGSDGWSVHEWVKNSVKGGRDEQGGS
jgi:hypothetical protein